MNKKKSKPQTGKRNPAPTGSARGKHMNERSTDHGKDHRTERSAERTRGIQLTKRDSYFLFGRNSVIAALENPNRECLRLIGTAKALTDIEAHKKLAKVTIETHENTDQIAASVPDGSPHQGILLEVRPLPGHDIQDLAPCSDEKNIILMLDQVTDPHNVGACIRSAAALGAKALITQDKNSPSESGVIARTAAGGLETLPWIQVANLSQTLDTLRDMGYWHVGLDGNTEQSIRTLNLGDNVVIVMGSEGKGLRPLVRKNCDVIAKIPMTSAVESLNVSNAAAIALYELGH